MRNFPLQTGFSAVELGMPCRVPGVWFDDFIGYGQTSNSSVTALTGTYMLTGTNVAAASIDIMDLASTDGGTVGAASGAIGAVKVSTTGTSGDDTVMQLEGASFLCTAGRQMVFQCRFRLDTITTAEQFFGMTIPGTNPLDTMLNGFGFKIVDGVVNYTVKNASATTAATATGATIAASTTTGWHTCLIRWDGKDALQFFLDGTLLITTRTNIPTGIVLTPTMAIETNSAAVKDMCVDYIYAAVEAHPDGR